MWGSRRFWRHRSKSILDLYCKLVSTKIDPSRDHIPWNDGFFQQCSYYFITVLVCWPKFTRVDMIWGVIVWLGKGVCGRLLSFLWHWPWPWLTLWPCFWSWLPSRSRHYVGCGRGHYHAAVAMEAAMALAVTLATIIAYDSVDEEGSRFWGGSEGRWMRRLPTTGQRDRKPLMATATWHRLS